MEELIAMGQDKKLLLMQGEGVVWQLHVRYINGRKDKEADIIEKRPLQRCLCSGIFDECSIIRSE